MKIFSKKKDETGLIDFIGDVKKLLKFINDKQSTQSIVIKDVIYIINTIKELNMRIELVKDNIKSQIKKDSKQKLMMKLLEDRAVMLNVLNEKVLIYEKQLSDYTETGAINDDDKK